MSWTDGHFVFALSLTLSLRSSAAHPATCLLSPLFQSVCCFFLLQMNQNNRVTFEWPFQSATHILCVCCAVNERPCVCFTSVCACVNTERHAIPQKMPARMARKCGKTVESLFCPVCTCHGRNVGVATHTNSLSSIEPCNASPSSQPCRVPAFGTQGIKDGISPYFPMGELLPDETDGMFEDASRGWLFYGPFRTLLNGVMSRCFTLLGLLLLDLVAKGWTLNAHWFRWLFPFSSLVKLFARIYRISSA